MDEERTIACEVANSLEIANFIRNIYIEETTSPWNEKALIKKGRESLDVKVTIWKDSLFLYGRIYRLFLYVYDMLSQHFQYRPEIAPDEDREPKLKDRHDQIWSIYVDSRVEKRGIENFYDKTVRRNIFIDNEKGLTWEEAGMIFQKLWEKDSYSYPEITDYTYNLDKLKGKDTLSKPDMNEVEINRFLLEPYVQKHIEKITSVTFRGFINKLLNFVDHNCKDTHIDSAYYGISFFCQKRVFLEMIPTRGNTLFLTLFDAALNVYSTHIITEDSNITDVQRSIEEMYNKVSTHPQFYNQ